MAIVKHCPNCGNETTDEEEFCTECGYRLRYDHHHSIMNAASDKKGFFDNLADKTSFPIIAFAFVIFGVFLFIGSMFWSSFMSSGSLDMITYIMLTVVFAVFFGGIFVGYTGCADKSYVMANVALYSGSIFAAVLCGIGLIFTFLMGIFSAMSSAFSSMGGSSTYGGSSQPAAPSYLSNIGLSGFFKIILFILLIPVAAYFGVYLGYILKDNI